MRILNILDGDTFDIQYFGHTMRLRFEGIDAPELGQPTFVGGKDAGKLSTECAKRIVKNQSYQMRLRKKDIYGRWIGDLINEKGESFSRQMLEEGCASLYLYSDGDQRESWRAQERAQRARKGLWKWAGYMRPYHYRKLSKKKARESRAQILGRKKDQNANRNPVATE